MGEVIFGYAATFPRLSRTNSFPLWFWQEIETVVR